MEIQIEELISGANMSLLFASANSSLVTRNRTFAQRF